MPVAENVELEEGVRIFKPDLVNIYGCSIGAETTIGPFVEIQSGVKIGKRCKISSHSFICSGITIEDGVFIGHGVMFTNDRDPAAVNDKGELKGSDDWVLEEVLIKAGAAIGSGAVILPGVTIGEKAVIGAGSVVTRDVDANTTVIGNPARPLKQ
ncbi:MAG: acyltransferase [Pseudomonadota bacterium]